MLIKQVSKNVVDVFVGVGWKQWTRFEIRGRLFKKIGGFPLSHDDLTQWKGHFYGH